MFLPKWSMEISTYPVTLILRLYQKFFTERVHGNFHVSCNIETNITKLEIVFTRAAPAFDNLFMGCVFNINTVHKTVEKLTFQAFY